MESSCESCHPGSTAYSSSHRDGVISLQPKLNKSPEPTPYGNNSSNFPQNANPISQQCSGVNCHFETITPAWGGTLQGGCAACHGAPPSYGAHEKHSTFMGTDPSSCSNCHQNHPTSGGPLAHAREAGSRPLYIQFSGAANRFGKYSTVSETNYPNYLPSQHPTRDGSCIGVYCHSSGKVEAPPLVATTWKGGPRGCNSCHGTGTTNTSGAPNYANGGAATALANSHPGHMNIGRTCSDCHIGTTDTGTSIADGSLLHINEKLDVTFKDGGSYDKLAKTCSGTNETGCHGPFLPVWGASGSCTMCHGGEAGSSNPIKTKAHRSHMNNYTTLGRGNNFLCSECHAATVSGNLVLVPSGKHKNAIYGDYTGEKAGQIAIAGSGLCNNAYCHSSGTKQNQSWNMSSTKWDSGASLSCSGCHGTLTLPDGTFQAYTSVAGEPSYPNTGIGTPLANSHWKHVVGIQSDTTGCSRCHRSTVDASIAGKLRDYSSAHLDKQRNVKFNAAIQGRYSSTTQQCLNLYCHSNGEPFDNSTTIMQTPTWGDSSLDCGSCHGDADSASRLSGRHSKHTASSPMFVSSCDRCHATTLNADGSLKDKKLHANRSKDVSFREGGTYNTVTKGCGSATYCHSDAANSSPPWGTATTDVKWSDKNNQMTCISCHMGTANENNEANCNLISGVWNIEKEYCTPSLTIGSNGHERLVGLSWIRKFPCYYCHNSAMDTSGHISDRSKHANGTKDIQIAPEWNMLGRPAASYDPATKSCDNVYCHSDGTHDPEKVKQFSWEQPSAQCNTCHGHPVGSCSNALCHDGRTDSTGRTWVLPERFLNQSTNEYEWPAAEQWKSAVPMFVNAGAGLARANSHARHVETNFSCDICHNLTIKQDDGTCSTSGCHPHTIGAPMDELAHLNGPMHVVNRTIDVSFKNGGEYDKDTKTCSKTGTGCHSNMGTDPVWGARSGPTFCLGCHGTTNADVDDFGTIFNGTQARINMTEWTVSGHGRYSTSGRYPTSGNPAANFPGDPCWYCHDNNVIHKDANNPFRLKVHNQFVNRFNKECVYCHMEETDKECLSCHNSSGSLAQQMNNPEIMALHSGNVVLSGCLATSECHPSDPHKTGAGKWTTAEKDDIKNQYLMMGVCLKCHDDDTNDRCTSCHTSTDPYKYAIGYNPGTGWIKPKKARATSAHFGYKHYKAHKVDGGWKGGKFCWDCHDPHGDKNIYMVQNMVATTTDGKFGKPITRAAVNFTRKQNGADYAKSVAPFDGICNVCHAAQNENLSKHFGKDYGDNHNASRICTTCHEHKFSDSHSNKQSCNTCHRNKPVPRHSGFGLPRDCTKCHGGVIGLRMDVMSQFKANSHHVQGVEITNKHCYACHWESTPDGLIDNQHHEGYNFKNYSTVKKAKVDLVVWGARFRPTAYKNNSTAIQFVASRMGADNATARTESKKLNVHCISCHSDLNNDTEPFEDCKTPRQYAWDKKSIDARYSQYGPTAVSRWSTYNTTGNPATGKYSVTKAFSAHGNATANAGGWSATTGTDGSITNTRAGVNEVTCFDCHSSHGSKVNGTTSSYESFNGLKNGGNLKETQAGKGGYSMSYKASSNVNLSSINPYSAGAGQCFDCHLTQNAGTTPWGYQSTFGATAAIKGYMDSDRFGDGTIGQFQRYPFKTKSMKGGHMKATSTLGSPPGDTSSGTCASCHDPHGVTPLLGSEQKYAVPLLKGTWVTSPYKEDTAYPSLTRRTTGSKSQQSYNSPPPTVYITAAVTEDDSKFAGLCLQCHAKSTLTDGVNKNTAWKSNDRIHESVKGWGANTKHGFTCSKCHTPHVTSLPRLLVTNCLDYKHRGNLASGTSQLFYTGSRGGGGFPGIGYRGLWAGTASMNCHPTGSWPNNDWNVKSKW